MSVESALMGATGGFLSGGPVGAIAGALGGIFGGGSKQECGKNVAWTDPRCQSVAGLLSGGPGVLLGGKYLAPVGPAAAAGFGPGSTGGIPDWILGGGISINPPFGGSPGVGVQIGGGMAPAPTLPDLPGFAGSGVNYATPTQQQNGSALPMVGTIGSAPEVLAVRTRRCPKGQVLARDGRCYPKSMVPRQLRAHIPDPKPPVTRSDVKAINKADRAKKRLVNLTKKAGAHASMTRPTRRGCK